MRGVDFQSLHHEWSAQEWAVRVECPLTTCVKPAEVHGSLSPSYMGVALVAAAVHNIHPLLTIDLKLVWSSLTAFGLS